MEDLHIYFNTDELEPQVLDWITDDYGVIPKLETLEKKHKANPAALHNELLTFAVDMLNTGFAHAPFAGIVVGHVIAHHKNPHVGKKAEAVLDAFEILWADCEQNDNLACCAFETYFCMACRVGTESPLSNRVHDHYYRALEEIVDVDESFLAQTYLATFQAPQAIPEFLVFSTFITQHMDSLIDANNDERLREKTRIKNWSKILLFAGTVGMNLKENSGVTSHFAGYFSRSWDALYKSDYEQAHEIIHHYLSNVPVYGQANPTFHRIILKKAEKLYGEKPLLGPSYPITMRPDKALSGLAPSP